MPQRRELQQCSARPLSQHDVDRSTGTGAAGERIVAALSSPLWHDVSHAVGETKRSLYSWISNEVGQKGERIRHGSAQRLSEHGGGKGVLACITGWACRVIVKQSMFMHWVDSEHPILLV
jgi:hypothetical protein